MDNVIILVLDGQWHSRSCSLLVFPNIKHQAEVRSSCSNVTPPHTSRRSAADAQYATTLTSCKTLAPRGNKPTLYWGNGGMVYPR